MSDERIRDDGLCGCVLSLQGGMGSRDWRETSKV